MKTMKNTLPALLSFTLLSTPLAATAQQFGDFTYLSDGSIITITGYTGPGGAVNIPATITGLPVTAVGIQAFYNRATVTSVTIPGSVTSLGDLAFYGCYSLTSVTIPASLMNIGASAFEGCGSLTSVTIPGSVTNIGSSAFYSTELRSVTIPGSVTSIGLGAFGFCGDLLGINVAAANASYSSAGGVLFNKGRTTLIQCPGGKAGSYSIPGSVTSIEDRAFADCTGLTSVTIPGSVTSIGSGAFWHCGLTTVTIPNSVTSIPDLAFADCANLTNVTIPASVTSIGASAFEVCTGLSNIILPGSVTLILDHAFAYCANLQGVYCQGNAPSVGGPYVFNYTSTVTVYYLRGTTGWGATFAGRPTKLWAINGGATAATLYVDVTSTNPTPPYTNWVTAATNIQDAVDAAVAGDEVVVTNGTYRPVNVDKPLSLRSINGPQFTTIDGGHSSSCAYLNNSASLSGFTLTNGSGSGGGGAYGGTLTNCTLSGNSAIGGSVSYQYLCGQQEGHIVWCTGYSHVPGYGGGAYRCTLNNCTLTGNSADQGGGASDSTVNNCELRGNSASYGGGAFSGTLNNCTLSGNSAIGGYGGGAYKGTLNNCTLTGNSGTGANSSTLNNCSLSGNSGGGADLCTLSNCTLTGNSPFGANSSTLNNCIAYFNTAPEGVNNYSSSTLNYCCTTPLPNNGVGNISQDPQLASASHLRAASPCRGAGNAAYASGTDIDGEAWANPPSIGCDEYNVGAVTGPLDVAITPSSTNVPVGLAVQLTALIEGRTTASSWSFGDGITATNQPYIAHTWTSPGDYSVELRARNESQADGISATVTVHVVAQPIHYVAADSASPVAPYTSWATASTNIQDALDAATEPGALVLVSNGTYATGGGDWDRVKVEKPLTLRSVNGPQSTVIDGGHSVRCVYLANGALLSGFTLTNGVGGVFGESHTAVVSNCVMVANSAGFGGGGGGYGGTLNNCILAGNSGSYGGGAANCTLNNCILTGNSANSFLYGDGNGYGGGAYSCTLNNCTLTGNSANWNGYGNGYGGGASHSTLNNCILYFNITGGRATDNYDSSTLNYCCTTPLPTNGIGNITSAPLVVDTNGWANLRLQSNSPCINAGNNSYLTNSYLANSFDLDGNPRTADGTVDIGAYEFQSPDSRISYDWLQQYGLPIDSSTETADPDGDGVDNYHEWLAGTNPTNRFSSPAQLTIFSSGANLILTWPTNAVGFTLQSTTNLVSPAVWSTNSPAPVVTAGQNTVTNPITGAQQFYRLVQ